LRLRQHHIDLPIQFCHRTYRTILPHLPASKQKTFTRTLATLTSELLSAKLTAQSEMSVMQPYTSKLKAAFSIRRTRTRPVFLAASRILALAASLLLWSCRSLAAETDTNSVPVTTGETNSQETLRAYLQLQEQLHITQLAIEQNRSEAREMAAQSSDMLVSRMQVIERALESQRTRELEQMQSANRAMLMVAGSFAGVGFIAMLLMCFFQWRTVNRLADISASLPANLMLGAAQSRGALAAGEGHLVSVGPAEQSSLRLLGAVEQLEKRIHELEHTTRTPLKEGRTAENGGKIASPAANPNGGSGRAADTAAAISSGEADRVAMLLGKGQSMLNLDNAEAAAACFEEALAIEPRNAEAWVRKGTAFERMQQLNEAIDCYDRAIAANSSFTIAYLHKGGLFNRMERFNEALECYEKALRTQERQHG
jgi:tetratricopeptide (TPR) repeat protein